MAQYLNEINAFGLHTDFARGEEQGCFSQPVPMSEHCGAGVLGKQLEKLGKQKSIK